MTIRIKYMGERYGAVHTVLPGYRYHRQPTQLRPEQLAQLIIDLKTVPQPEMRPREAENLAQVLLEFADRRYGRVFRKTLTSQFIVSLGQVAAYDACCSTAEKLMLARQRSGKRPTAVAVLS